MFSRGWQRRDITRAADRSAFTGPVERRPELSTKAELAQRGPVACYLIVLLARRDAPSWSRFRLLSLAPFGTAPLYGLSSCFVIGISLPLYIYLSQRSLAPDPLLPRPLFSFSSCSFHCVLGEPPNSPVNRREATIVKASRRNPEEFYQRATATSTRIYISVRRNVCHQVMTYNFT